MAGSGTAVISGTTSGATSAALQAQGFTTHEAPDTGALHELVVALGAGSVDLYVQLPTAISSRGGNAVEVVRNFLTDGLIARFDAASAVVPALTEHATVVLVSGNHPGKETDAAPDNPEARLSLMKVLGHTLLLQQAGKLTVKIVDQQQTAERIAEVAVARATKPLSVISDLAASTPDLDYAEWRDGIMNLTGTQA